MKDLLAFIAGLLGRAFFCREEEEVRLEIPAPVPTTKTITQNGGSLIKGRYAGKKGKYIPRAGGNPRTVRIIRREPERVFVRLLGKKRYKIHKQGAILTNIDCS
jgi:hypothetical protein